MSESERESMGGENPERSGTNDADSENGNVNSRNASIGRDVKNSTIATGDHSTIQSGVHHHYPPGYQPQSDPTPAKTTPPKIQTDSLPVTDPHLFGREEELAALDSAWESEKTNIVTIVAWGGVGKSALMNRWVREMCGPDDCRGAARVFGWSFYSQGAGEGKQASADRFVDAALRWFDDPEPEAGSPTEKGRRLAAMVQAERTLLILDGLEPVQHPPGPQEGKLKDEALRALLRNLAVRNPGMCLITTRLAVDDLRTHEKSTVSQMELRHLSPEAGAAVLERLGVTGPNAELETASTEFDGHALALNLLGTYLESLFDGDVRQRDKIPVLADEEVGQGGHARRVMDAYETWLAETEKGQRALSILRIMGLFDRPAEKGAIDAVTAGDPIPGLTDALKGLGDKGWKLAVRELRKLKLLAEPDADRPDALDCHPLVREHFGERLKAEFPEGWKEAHGRLYEFYKALPEKELPDTLEEMEPLFAAVAHGCFAGRHQEALYEVYYSRIQRDGQTNFCCKKLGAFGADLAAVSQFFETAWTTPAAGLTDQFQAGVLSWAGFRLRAMGRLREAVEPNLASLNYDIENERWRFAAIAASNLSELHLTLGDVAEAVAYGQRSVEFADRSGDGFMREVTRTIHADALHQAGDLDAAEALFQEAEALQAERQPHYPRLYSLRGYQFCDLLLSRGRDGEVVERATQMLEWEEEGWLLDIALDHLSLGRAHLLQALADGTGDFAPAETHLNAAVEGLRQAGDQSRLPLGLFARAALFRATNQFQLAWDDLNEAHEIAQFGEMRLFLADYHLEAARLCLAQNQREQAAEHVSEAEKLIEETGYHRRDGEVAALRGALGNGPPPFLKGG
jgi:tetratricopeptide (TPR) repeat protein